MTPNPNNSQEPEVQEPDLSWEELTAGAMAELMEKARQRKTSESSPGEPTSPNLGIPNWFRKAYDTF